MSILAESPPRWTEQLAKWAGPLVVAFIFLSLSLLCIEPGITPTLDYMGEGGPVEIGSAILLPFVAVLYLLWRRQIGAESRVPALMLLLMTMRELDGDKWLTNKSLLSTGYYFDNPGVGYSERFLVGLVVGTIGFLILRLLWRARHDIVDAVRAFEPYCRSLMLAFFLMGASQVLDGAGRTHRWLMGGGMPDVAHAVVSVLEETSELAMALAFLVALLQLRLDPGRNALPAARVRQLDPVRVA